MKRRKSCTAACLASIRKVYLSTESQSISGGPLVLPDVSDREPGFQQSCTVARERFMVGFSCTDGTRFFSDHRSCLTTEVLVYENRVTAAGYHDRQTDWMQLLPRARITYLWRVGMCWVNL